MTVMRRYLRHSIGVLPACIVLATLSAPGGRANAFAGQAATTPYRVRLQQEHKLPGVTFTDRQPARIALPALPSQSGLVPVLRFRLFVTTPAASGFNYNAQLKLNGSELGRKTARGGERLCLRPTSFNLRDHHYDVFQDDKLAVMFAPDADKADAMTDDGLGATFLLDISDVARGVDNNELEILKPINNDLVGTIQDLAVGWIDQSLLVQAGAEKVRRTLPELQLRRDETGLAVGRRGGFILSFRDGQLCVESGLGLTATAVQLTATDTALNGAVVDDVSVDKTSDAECLIKARWPSGVRLERRLQLLDSNMLSWKDSWTNTSTADTPVPFNYRLFLNDGRPESQVLGGVPDTDFVETSPFNPTVYLGDNDHHVGFGWVAEDDWLRHLLRFSHDSISSSVSSRNLALRPGQSIAFDMTLQPTASASYWDFINDVRQRWHVNDVTIAAPIVWGWRNPLPGRGPLIQVAGDWMGLGPDVRQARAETPGRPDERPKSDAIERFYHYGHQAAALAPAKNTLDSIRKAAPDTRVMMMMHPSMEVVYKPDFGSYPHRNSAILTQSGQPFEDPGYSRSWLSNATQQGWGILYMAPRPGSTYLQTLVDRVHQALDDIKADGIYCDEFTFDGLRRNYSRYDYRQWDGYSVLLDARGQITARVTDNGVATIPAQMALIKAAQERHKLMLVNTAPTSREVQTAGIYHFNESGNGLWWGANMHLTTPMQLGNQSQPDSTESLLKLSRKLLSVGTLHVPAGKAAEFMQGPDNFISKQFPITPVRVGPGFVIGRERLITAESRDFSWPMGGSSDLLVWSYDSGGKLAGDAPKRLAAAASPLHVTVPAGGLVIVEKAP